MRTIALNPEPFEFAPARIAYDGNYRAKKVDWPPVAAQLQNASCLFGLWDISDDESVHADHWERHPAGDETLVVVEGALRLFFDADAPDWPPVLISAGMALIVPAGRWHRLEVVEPGKLLTFTPAEGGELRPVDGAPPSGRD